MKETTETNESQAILSHDWQLMALSIDLVHRFGCKAGVGWGGPSGLRAQIQL